MMIDRYTSTRRTPLSDLLRGVIVVTSLLLCSVAPSTAQTPTVSARDAWIREPRPSRTETAAFAVLTNDGAEDRAIVSASVAIAEKVELHETRLEGGMMRMKPVER